MADGPARDRDTAFEAWDERWRHPEAETAWLTPEPDVLERLAELGTRGTRRALDLGCGLGRHALACAEAGLETVALDASASGLAHLRAEAARRGRRIACIEGRMTALPFADASFDYLLSWNVVYHGDGEIVAQVIAEIARVLAPGGIFQGTLLSKRSSRFGRGREIAPDTFVDPEGDGDKAHPHFFCDAAGLLALFAGFEAWSLRDVDQKGSADYHWHFVAERR